MSAYAFSPLILYSLIRDPLVYYFSNYKPGNIQFDVDETKSDLLITSVENYTEVRAQTKPRLLIDRGPYRITSFGIGAGMAAQKGPYNNLGATDTTYRYSIDGQAQITVEARNLGTVELLTDIVSTFIAWSSPILCLTQGFKKFGMPVDISSPRPSKEDTEIFQVLVTIPWSTESLFHTYFDAVKLKAFFMSMSTNGQVDNLTINQLS